MQASHVAETFAIGGELEVRSLGFGAMRLCGPAGVGWPPDRERSLAVLRRARALGTELVDTADSYCRGVNELQVRAALHPYAGVVVATKVGLVNDGTPSFPCDGRPEHLVAAAEASCLRLAVETIDLLQLHRPDPEVPFAESVGALAGLRERGVVRHVGLSNVTVEQLREAQAIVPVASVQNRYSLGRRDDDAVVDACSADGVAFLPWEPLHVSDPGAADLVARRHGATRNQVALAWLLARSPVVCPIPGTSSIAHLEENTAARDLRLDPDDLALLRSDRDTAA